jgi:RNA polymerase sigma-70 factor (ECF subfamily)
MKLDERAFEQLFRDLGPRIHAYLCRRAGSAVADDLLAETFLVVWRRRDELPPAPDRSAWIHGVARRLLLAHWREANADPVLMPSMESPATTVLLEPVTGAARPDDRRQHLVHALDGLPDVDRELITLTVWERMTTREAALVVGLKPGAARVRLHRARRRLAAAVEDVDAGEPAAQVRTARAALRPTT